IGMIIGEVIRKFYWGYEIGLEMLLNIMIGGVVMIIGDFIGSRMIEAIEIGVGMVMGLVGVGVVFYILIKESKI
uniref:iron chelate uptake ABC transporter family permease subunit n=1 Tax=Staphylococcus epidermidis TaxID=1282 RepID=UPI00119CBBEE